MTKIIKKIFYKRIGGFISLYSVVICAIISIVIKFFTLLINMQMAVYYTLQDLDKMQILKQELVCYYKKNGEKFPPVNENNLLKYEGEMNRIPSYYRFDHKKNPFKLKVICDMEEEDFRVVAIIYRKDYKKDSIKLNIFINEVYPDTNYIKENVPICNPRNTYLASSPVEKGNKNPPQKYLNLFILPDKK
jgi:hypothetical protein